MLKNHVVDVLVSDEDGNQEALSFAASFCSVEDGLLWVEEKIGDGFTRKERLEIVAHKIVRGVFGRK